LYLGILVNNSSRGECSVHVLTTMLVVGAQGVQDRQMLQKGCFPLEDSDQQIGWVFRILYARSRVVRNEQEQGSSTIEERAGVNKYPLRLRKRMGCVKSRIVAVRKGDVGFVQMKPRLLFIGPACQCQCQHPSCLGDTPKEPELPPDRHEN
jgi:hypothetical protein